MEKQLFTFTHMSWIRSTLRLSFSNVCLTRDIGDFEKGDRFDVALVDYEKARLTLQRDNEEWSYPLLLDVGK
jgi:hypothetical protein